MQRETRVRLWERLIKRRADSGPPLDQKMGRPGRPIQVRPLPRGLPGLLGYECLNGPQCFTGQTKPIHILGLSMRPITTTCFLFASLSLRENAHGLTDRLRIFFRRKKKNPVVSLRIFFRHLFSLPASSVKAAAGYIRFLPDRASLLQSPRPSLAGNAG